MNKLLACFALLASPAALLAQENFLGNGATPYPPGCASNAEAMTLIPGRETEVTAATLQFPALADPASAASEGFLDVEMKLIRRGCAEANRSLLMVELTVLDNDDGQQHAIPLPAFEADRFGNRYALRGVAEPNAWSAHAEGQPLAEGESIRLFLDGPAQFGPLLDQDPLIEPPALITPAQYNGDWDLLITEPILGNGYRIMVPGYRNQLQADGYVLNGRLSGIWWVADAPDQGIFLGFLERTNDPSGVLFLSWNTFGPNGENLWLSGNGDYQLGDSEVLLDLVWVTDGDFMGTRSAQRSPAGTVRLIANSCNDLTMEFSITIPGLASGARRLTRPFALETQGYACRDLDARIDSL